MHNKPRLRFAEFTDEWQWKKLGELFTFKSTNSLSRDKLTYKPSPVKNIHYGDIHTKFSHHLSLDNEMIPFILDEENYSFIANENYIVEGDVIIADASEDIEDIGKAVEVTSLENFKGVAGLHTILARPNQGTFKIGFLGHLFASPYARKQIQRESQGTKVLGISVGRVQKIVLPLPSLPEQEKIAECLSSLDELISAEREKLTLFEEYKRGLMQGLFPNTHNNLHNKTDSKYNEDDQEITAPPPPLPRLRFKEFTGEWKMVKLGEVVIRSKGRIVKVDEDGIYPYIGASSFGGCFTEFTNDANAIFCSKQDVLILWDGENAGNSTTGLEGAVGSTVAKLVLKDMNVSNTYINYHLQRNIKLIRENRTGSGIPHMPSDFEDWYTIPLPSLQEQEKIAQCLSSLDELITASSEYVETLETMKKGLMQGMFPAHA